jgi:hypothetical protein
MKNKFDGKEYYDELKEISKDILESVEKEVTSWTSYPTDKKLSKRRIERWKWH